MSAMIESTVTTGPSGGSAVQLLNECRSSDRTTNGRPDGRMAGL